MNFPKKHKLSLDENFSSLSENLSFKLFNRLNYDIYFDMRMSFGHTLLDWKDTNKSFGLSVINHRCVLNMEATTLGFRRAFLFLAQAISSYRRSNILFVSGLPAHDNFQDFLKFHQSNLPLLGHGYMLHWVAGLLTNMGILIETFWGKATTVVSRYQKQSKRDWFLEAAKGMRIFQRFPDFVVFFSISGIYEIAIKEASLLKIPTLAFVDSNCEVNNIPFFITGNDDFAFGLELKIFLFRELILRTMKQRLFTEIDKLLLESKSLQQFMVDSYMEEFMKEVSDNYKNKINTKSESRGLFFSKRNFAKKITKSFLRLLFSYFSKIKVISKLIVQYKFSYRKSNVCTLSLQFMLPQHFNFIAAQKQQLNLNKYFWNVKKISKKGGKIKKNINFEFLYKILFFCFKNSLKISQKKLEFLGNCFFLKKKQGMRIYESFFNFCGLHTCFKSFLFSLIYFNRAIFGFNIRSKASKVKLYFSTKIFKATASIVFSSFTVLKRKLTTSFLTQKNVPKNYSSKFLQFSDSLKKKAFLKSFLFWKLKKVHTRSRLKLDKTFSKFKYKVFGLLKYTRFLQFFPFLRSFLYRKFKRSKFAKHPISALHLCVFFLPKRLFFRRKWYLRSPPFLFKRYTKFFKFKAGVTMAFPKTLPPFHDKKDFRVLLFKTKALYKKKLSRFEKLREKVINAFEKSSQKMQEKFLLKIFRVWKVWKLLFFLKNKKNIFLPLNFFLSKFVFQYINFSRFAFHSIKTSLTLALKKTQKSLVLSPVFRLIYFELYFLMKSGAFSVFSSKDFIFARFLCFFRVFSGFNLQFFFSNSVLLSVATKSVPNLQMHFSSKKFINKFFLLSVFKRAKIVKLYYAKTFNQVETFAGYLRRFLSNMNSTFKMLRSAVFLFTAFSKDLFSRFFKILSYKLQKISNSRRYVSLEASFTKNVEGVDKKKGVQVLLCNRKFKQARNFYFLNSSKKIAVMSKFNVSKNHINFLKLFVPAN